MNSVETRLTIELVHEAGELGWFVKVNELDGCMSQGNSIGDALDMIQDAMYMWLDEAVKNEPAHDDWRYIFEHLNCPAEEENEGDFDEDDHDENDELYPEPELAG